MILVSSLSGSSVHVIDSNVSDLSRAMNCYPQELGVESLKEGYQACKLGYIDIIAVIN